MQYTDLTLTEAGDRLRSWRLTSWIGAVSVRSHSGLVVLRSLPKRRISLVIMMSQSHRKSLQVHYGKQEVATASPANNIPRNPLVLLPVCYRLSYISRTSVVPLPHTPTPTRLREGANQVQLE